MSNHIPCLSAGAGLRLAALVALLSILVAGCDDKIEKTVGDATASSVEQQYQVSTDPLLNQWVTSAGHTLHSYVLRQDVPYEFKVLDADLVNAFAAPYGHIYVTTGLLDFAQSEDEVWAIIGHEIGHVARRHGMSDLKRNLAYSLGVALVGGSSETLGAVAGAGVGLLSLKYSRDQEYEADDVGRRLTFAAGHDPRGNVDFFQRLMERYEKDQPSSIEIMFQTHPPSRDRADRMLSMPELSGSNPDALLQTGRGYLRRYQLRRAGELLARAAAERPRDPSVLVSLAEVERRRGQYAQALEHYAVARDLAPSQFVERGLALASAGPRPVSALLDASERRTTDTLSARLLQGATVRAASLASAGDLARDLADEYAPQAEGARGVVSSLLALAELDPPTSEDTQSLLAQASSVISRALDPVYAVETQRQALAATAGDLQAADARMAGALSAEARDRLSAADLAVLQRMETESRLARVDVHAALAELDGAQDAIDASVESAGEAASWVDKIMKGDDSSYAQTHMLDAIAQAELRALPAQAATREATLSASSAALRALVVRISAAGLGQSPELRDMLDGLVGHYLLTKPEIVRALREQGAGFGEAAVVLAAAPSASTGSGELLRAALQSGSAVDEITQAGAQTSGARVLLRFLAQAAEYEIGS